MGIWMSDPEDVPVIFETLGTAIEVSNGETRWLTAMEAKSISHIARMKLRPAETCLIPSDGF